MPGVGRSLPATDDQDGHISACAKQPPCCSSARTKASEQALAVSACSCHTTGCTASGPYSRDRYLQVPADRQERSDCLLSTILGFVCRGSVCLTRAQMLMR